MRTHPLTLALAGALLAAPAAAQEARPAPPTAENPLRLRRDLAPQLYFLKIQGLIQDKLVDPKAWRYDKEALVRVVLDGSGAVVHHDFVQRAGLPIYDRAIEDALNRFGPEGVDRLPVADDASLKAQASGAGVLVTLRFRGTAPPRAPESAAPASASPKTPKER